MNPMSTILFALTIPGPISTGGSGARAAEPVALEEVEVAGFSLPADEDLLPLVVRAKLAEESARMAARWRHAAGGPGEEPVSTGSVWRVNLPRPGHRCLQLIAGRLPSLHPDRGDWAVLVHDPESDEVTATPVICSGWWLYGDEGLHPRLADLDRDGRPEVVLHHHRHNGTVADADEAVFLAVGDDLSLTEVLRIVEREMDSSSLGEWGARRQRLLRPVTADGRLVAGRLVLETWREDPHHHADRDLLPSVTYRLDPATGAWSAETPGR